MTANEPFERSIGHDDRPIARPSRGRALGPHHGGLDEGAAAFDEFGDPAGEIGHEKQPVLSDPITAA
jgi:hypothetical protein